jgi:predicted ATPase/Tfp pilus assembly protein PilF/DNA-binding XRE family transcriptional regulator
MENDGQSSGLPQFGVLLRQHRLAAGLSQEALADRAQISVDGISALERGHRRTPQRETLALLVGALALAGERRREFEAAAARSGTRRRQNGSDVPSFPLALTSFIGREVELEECATLVREHRLVTLTGAGGIGKTRMALHLGSARNQALEGSVRFISLATVGRSSVAAAVASAVGVHETANRPVLETLISFLKSKSFVLILDNCEHVVAEAAVIADTVLTNCPGIRLLATSREPLKAAGERVYRLPSLNLRSAIALFSERARCANHRFTLTDENAPIVIDLCRRLDGIPLAIELAAARVDLMSLKILAERLDERFAVLTNGERLAVPRQQTMHATIDWSYALLSCAEQSLFERLSIFIGGCTIEAVEAVVSDQDLRAAEVLDLLSSLADKSLVIADLEDRARYRLLDTTRAFALEKLAEKGALARLARRHAEWAANLADDASTIGSSMPIDRWARALEPELENARSAIEWALSAREISLAARIACGLTSVWRLNHGNDEPRRWLEHVLPELGRANGSLAGRIWHTLSTVTFGVHRVAAAQRAIELEVRNGGQGATAGSLYQLGQGLLEAGRIEDAEAANERALRFCIENALTRSRRYAALLDMRARIAATRERVDEARQHYLQALSLFTALGDEHEAILIRINMGELEYRAGHFHRALEFADAAVMAARRLPSRHREITALANSAACCLALGDLQRARVNARDALTLTRWAPPLEVTIAVQHLATVAALSDDERRAAHLCGYVDAWYGAEGCERELTERRGYETLLAALREKLDETEIARLAASGAAFSEERAVAEALRV